MQRFAYLQPQTPAAPLQFAEKCQCAAESWGSR